VSQQDVELVRQVAEGLPSDVSELATQEVVNTLLDRLDPDFVFVIDATEDLTGVGGDYPGPEGFLAAMREWLSVWETYERWDEEFVDAGEGRVLSLSREKGRLRGGGEIEQKTAAIWTVRDGKIARVHAFQDRGRARRAVGLG
jgi:ketosteroid isomerase-like protein